MAAFALGAAHEAVGDRGAARRAYRMALGAAETDGAERADRRDLAAACRARLDVVVPSGASATG
ncbi:MAG TPA: hypothetical protein VGJ70_16730 [Solirubrobacteraceae bacterium]